MTDREYVIVFWRDPEEALKTLILEQVAYCKSRRELARLVEERSKSGYAKNAVAEITATFWISWAFGKKGRTARIPSYKNGVQLFRILLDLKKENEKAIRTP